MYSSQESNANILFDMLYDIAKIVQFVNKYNFHVIPRAHL